MSFLAPTPPRCDVSHSEGRWSDGRSRCRCERPRWKVDRGRRACVLLLSVILYLCADTRQEMQVERALPPSHRDADAITDTPKAAMSRDCGRRVPNDAEPQGEQRARGSLRRERCGTARVLSRPERVTLRAAARCLLAHSICNEMCSELRAEQLQRNMDDAACGNAACGAGQGARHMPSREASSLCKLAAAKRLLCSTPCNLKKEDCGRPLTGGTF